MCDLQMEREALFFSPFLFFSYLINALCVCLLWLGRRRANDLFPPIPAAADQALLRWPPRSPELTPCDFFCGDLLRAVSSCLLNYRIYPRNEDEWSLPSQKWIVTCFSGYGQKLIIGLTSAVSERADTESPYEVCKETWRVSLSIFRSHVAVISVVQVCRFY